MTARYEYIQYNNITESTYVEVTSNHYGYFQPLRLLPYGYFQPLRLLPTIAVTYNHVRKNILQRRIVLLNQLDCVVPSEYFSYQSSLAFSGFGKGLFVFPFLNRENKDVKKNF